MKHRPLIFLHWLVQRLYKAGTRHLFGIPGGGTSLDLIEAAASQRIELVLTAREDAALIMAGVSGVLTQGPGLAFSTKGPGLTSAANGLAAASLDRMPALLIAETFVPGELDYVSHQAYDQSAVVQPLLPNGPMNVLDASREAVDSWLACDPQPARQPAVMFPTRDAFRELVNADYDSELIPTEKLVGQIELARTCELVNSSLNPIVIVGLEAARPEIASEVKKLVEAFNAPVLSSYMASGTVPVGHPNYAGIFTGGAIEQPCVNEADLIVLVGLDPVELIRKPWPYQAPVVDICEAVHQPHYLEPKVRLCAPLADSLPALVEGIRSSTSKSEWSSKRITSHRDRFYKGLEIEVENGLSASFVVKAAAEAFGGKPRLTVDAGAHMFSACAFWPSMAPRDILISNGLATMGFALPAALAAAIHDPARGAVAMTGDGGLMMCLGELKTVAQMNANICIIVFNDGCLSLIDIKREERQISDLGLNWNRPDFSLIAKGFGFQSWRPANTIELNNACAEAATQSGPRLIDAQVDPSGYLKQMRALRG